VSHPGAVSVPVLLANGHAPGGPPLILILILKSMPHFEIRAAQAEDAAVLLALIRELADYENSLHAVQINEEKLRRWVFTGRPCAEAFLGFADAQPAGYAIVFPTFGSYRGTPSLYIEDIYIQDRWRGHGFGKSMMAFLARLAASRGYAHLSWSVLDWNQPSIDFYTRLGAVRTNGHIHMKLDGDAFRRLAGMPAEGDRPA
jgi:GNAT superfamily N-acetyltransferase